MAFTFFRSTNPNLLVYQNYGTAQQTLLGTAVGLFEQSTHTTRIDGNYNETDAGGEFTFLFVPDSNSNKCRFEYVSDGYFKIDLPVETASSIEYEVLGRPVIIIIAEKDYTIRIDPILRGAQDQTLIGNQFIVNGPQTFVFQLIFA